MSYHGDPGLYRHHFLFETLLPKFVNVSTQNEELGGKT